MTRTHSILGLAVFLALSYAAALIGGLSTHSAIPEWYAALRKPAFTPPSWVFGPAWTILYATMGVAAWLAWRERGGFPGARAALLLFLLQLGLNAAWSVLFFGLRLPGVAFAEILLLWIAIGATCIAFGRIRPLAGWLLVPYLAWVAFAAVLNGAIWRLNPRG